MPKAPVETPITNQEIEFALLLLAGKHTDQAAAGAVGFSASQAAYIKNKPRVKEYMAEHRAAVAAAITQHEADTLVQHNIGREQIMVQYWALANMPPEKTNANITGQVKALDSLREMLSLTGPETSGKPENEMPEQPQIYRARWLRKPGDPDYEEDYDPEEALGQIRAGQKAGEAAAKPIRAEAHRQEDSRVGATAIANVRHLPPGHAGRF